MLRPWDDVNGAGAFASVAEMHGETSGAPRVNTRMSLRQAMVAVVASAAVIGGIAAFSGSDDGRSVALSPGQTTTTTPMTGGTSLAPVLISPDASTVVGAGV